MVEGKSSDDGWMLLDFGSIVVHVMTPEAKAHYRLEELWTTDEFEILRNQHHFEDDGNGEDNIIDVTLEDGEELEDDQKNLPLTE